MESITATGLWVDQLYHDVFFQPDDGLSQKRLQDSLHPEFKMNFNGTTLTTHDWIRAITEARDKNVLEVISSRELLTSRKAENGNISVAHISNFTLTDKKTGERKEESSVTLSTISENIPEKNGGKLLVGLVEVYRASV